MTSDEPMIPAPTDQRLAHVELLAMGKTNSEIGDLLFRSVDTVKGLMKALSTEYGVASREELISLAFRNDWFSPAARQLIERALVDPDAPTHVDRTARMRSWVSGSPWVPDPSSEAESVESMESTAESVPAPRTRRKQSRSIYRGTMTRDEIFARWPITCADVQELHNQMGGRPEDRFLLPEAPSSGRPRLRPLKDR